MANYALMYRLGVRPWESYLDKASEEISSILDAALADLPAGRALDLGCGRGRYSAQLAERGWEVVGVDAVPQAIDAAQTRAGSRETYLVGDVTDLPAGLGTFDFFLDVGCLQGLSETQMAAYGREVTAAANPGATMLSLQFGRSRYRRLVGGISRDEIARALPDWEILTTQPAQTRGMGWPMNRTSPTWYRLALRT